MSFTDQCGRFYWFDFGNSLCTPTQIRICTELMFYYNKVWQIIISTHYLIRRVWKHLFLNFLNWSYLPDFYSPNYNSGEEQNLMIDPVEVLKEDKWEWYFNKQNAWTVLSKLGFDISGFKQTVLHTMTFDCKCLQMFSNWNGLVPQGHVLGFCRNNNIYYSWLFFQFFKLNVFK